jgi:hypothetical protein
MINDFLKVCLDALKLAPRYLIAIGAVAAFLLFSSHSLLKHLGVLEFAQNSRQWLGLILLITTSLFCVDLILRLASWIRKRRGESQFYKRMKKRLCNLTEDEKQILRYYLAKQTRSNVLRIDDGVVQGLAGAGIIHQSASLGNMIEGFAHNINDFAWCYLYEHIELLDGTTKTYRTDKRDYLR